MTRLILTNGSSAAGNLKVAGRADIVIAIEQRFVWGRLPSDEELAGFFAARTNQEKGRHWQDYTPRWRLDRFGATGLGLIEFCAKCESIELWIDPEPNDQLMLLWLLDYLRPHPTIVSKLTLLQADVVIGGQEPEELVKWPPAVKITNDQLELACVAWQAYRAPTPQDWFGLLAKDLSSLPQLRSAVLALLEELPSRVTGLGATEMRVLQLVDEGGAQPPDLFPSDKRNERRVFDYWAFGALLDGLAHCPAPVIFGLDEGPFTMEMHDDRERRKRYWQSTLSLTPLGEAILAGRDDFTRHNPVHRWWGGTELTNDGLWRWDPAKRALVAP